MDTRWGGGVLPLCREAVDVFYSPRMKEREREYMCVWVVEWVKEGRIENVCACEWVNGWKWEGERFMCVWGGEIEREYMDERGKERECMCLWVGETTDVKKKSRKNVCACGCVWKDI